VLLAGCSDGTTTTTDSGETDVDTDVDTDTDTDADSDTDSDIDDPAWEHCPDSTVYTGDDSWSGTLAVTSDALYCGGFNEERTLEAEQIYKAQMRLVPGEYAVPASDGEHSLALPVCTLVGSGVPGPTMNGAGDTSVTLQSWSGTTYTYLVGSQPLVDPLDAAFTLQHALVLYGDEGSDPEILTANGEGPDPNTGAGVGFYLYPEGGSQYDADAINFYSCNDATWTPESHWVEFDGGDITLDLLLGENTVQTAPGSFARAAGTLDGESFEITNYFQLFYRPDHHHFGRHFAVLFDAPIGQVCALRIEQVDPLEGPPTAIVSTAECDLTVIEVRETTDETYTLGG
jgi:hypothetical protein